MAEVWQFFAHEDDYQDLNQSAAVEHLSRVLQFKTNEPQGSDETAWSEFNAQFDYLATTYPHVFGRGTVEKIGHSILIILPGTNTDLKPVLYMAHQDVVPVVKGTEADWTYDAYSGHVDDTYIWGRGAIDMQSQLVGMLEGVEYVLAHGATFERTLMFGFGEDEETTQYGAANIARTLKERGIELEFLLDEGDYLVDDAALYGAPGTRFMHVCLSEKGYCDVRIDAKSIGGHSSNPFGGTSLETLAHAISRICAAPYPLRLTELTQTTLALLAPYMTEGPIYDLIQEGEKSTERSVREAIAAKQEELARVLASIKGLNPLVHTTIAPTMIEGGASQANVMPQNMYAVINFRLLEGTCGADVLEKCRELCSDLSVSFSLLNGSNDPIVASKAEGYGWEKLNEVAARYFVDPGTGKALPLIPTLAVGATDARMYEDVCGSLLRFSAFTADEDEINRGVHGTDERITIRSYLQGIRFIIKLTETVCCA